jgi:hypothetical protein
VLHTTRARERTETDLGLPQYAGPIRFIGGASIATHSTPSSLRATRSVWYVWVIVGSSTPARCRLKGTLTTD